MNQEAAITDYLLAHRLVGNAALLAAKQEQEITGKNLSLILVRNGFIRQDAMTAAILEAAPDQVDAESTFVEGLPSDVLSSTQTMVLAETSRQLMVATLQAESLVKASIAPYDTREIVFRPASVSRIDQYMTELLRLANSSKSSFLDRLLRQAIRDRVSDVHILPRADSYTTQGRYLGSLKMIHEGALSEYNTLVARIKDRANMDLSERRLPQSGGFSVEHEQRLVDMRVETIPSLQGEKVVIRLLDPDAVNPKLDTLGISRIEEWRHGFTRRNGLCLICGPTGSGKTTTLNATVREMDRFSRHICTIEDPVEYALPFVTQVTVNNAVGLDFSKALRSFMRLDPDIIILGEIRDEESAALAVKAAETGHLVLATLHTSSIEASIERLEYLGVRRLDMKYLLRSVLVQNLMRAACRQCQGKGCHHCSNAGYTHRTIVSECAYFPDEKSVVDLLDGQRSWPLLVEDAVSKYKEGITTLDELKRTFAEEITPYLDAD